MKKSPLQEVETAPDQKFRTLAELISLAGVPKGYVTTFEKFFLKIIYPECELINDEGVKVRRGKGKNARLKMDFSQQLDSEQFYLAMKSLASSTKKAISIGKEAEEDYWYNTDYRTITIPLDTRITMVEELLEKIDKAVTQSSQLEESPITSRVNKVLADLGAELGVKIVNLGDEGRRDNLFRMDYDGMACEMVLIQSVIYNGSDDALRRFGSPRISNSLLEFPFKESIYEAYEDLEGLKSHIKDIHQRVLKRSDMTQEEFLISSKIVDVCSVKTNQNSIVIGYELNDESFWASDDLWLWAVNDVLKRICKDKPNLSVSSGTAYMEFPLLKKEAVIELFNSDKFDFKNEVIKAAKITETLSDKGLGCQERKEGIFVYFIDSELVNQPVMDYYKQCLRKALPAKHRMEPVEGGVVISYETANWLNENYQKFVQAVANSESMTAAAKVR